MTALILLAALVTAAALWWLVRPLRAAAVIPSGTEERAELLELRDRLLAQLRELDAEHADRGMDAVTVRDEETRLSAELAGVLRRLDAPVAAAPSPSAAPRRGLAVGVTLALVLLVVGVGLYALQNGRNLAGFMQAANQGFDSTRVPPMVLDMVTRLEKRLQDNPNDADGWGRLGRAYVVMERKEEALAAYARAYALAPDNAAVLSDYAWLVFNQDPSVTTGLAHDLYSRLHKLEPQHPDALWFLGFSAYQKGEFRTALGLWERLLKLLPADDPGRQHLQQAIDAARAKARR
jgi:cytochrome c-type biogenesis protein CcmH